MLKFEIFTEKVIININLNNMSVHLKLDESFKAFQEDMINEKYASPLQIPINIWQNPSWELLKKEELEELLLPFLQFSLHRAIKTIPVYKGAYKNIPKIDSFQDFQSIPILVKDSTNGDIGFREKMITNPYILSPNDIKSHYQVYRSGGTKGEATPTFITPLDREIESAALARAFSYIGFSEGDRILSTYNPTHKGGEEIKESILKIGATYIPRRSTDSAEDLIKLIEHYNINAVITSQGPVSDGDKVAKGGGTSLLSLIEAGHDVIEKHVEKIALAGYNIIDDVINWAQTFKKPVASLLGSSEAIPQGASISSPNGTKICQFNNLHLFNGPHYIEVVKEEDNTIVPVKKGEKGLLVYTTIAREGTIYIRYAPGDEATLLVNESECECGLKSKIISNINRIDNPNDIISTGCCIG